MATAKSQRIGIWIIAIVMTVGTIGSFAVMVLANDNAKIDQAQQQKLYAEYQKQLDEQKKQGEALSALYYPTFKPYQTAPAAFDPASVGDKVIKNDLKVGNGAELTADTTYQAYYIGWNPKGKTFDSSFDGETLKAPIDTSQATLIPGWNEGVIGMKVGGVREITIPSDLAYKDQGSGNDIPPNTPIKFIVYVIATTELKEN
jgi:FKBP-type peptidyl-prolyl cis-trans isomerase